MYIGIRAVWTRVRDTYILYVRTVPRELRLYIFSFVIT